MIKGHNYEIKCWIYETYLIVMTCLNFMTHLEAEICKNIIHT